MLFRSEEIIRLNRGNEYREGALDKPRRVGPLEHYIPQHDWEDISNINGGEDDNKL